MDPRPGTTPHRRTQTALLLVGLALAAAALAAAAPAQTPPRTLDQIPRVANPRGLLRIWTYAEANLAERSGSPTNSGAYHGIEHPFATWSVGAHTVTGNVETWSGCSVPGRPGTFDLRRSTAYVDAFRHLVSYEVRPDFSPGSGVGIHRLRWVERLDPDLPGIADGEARVLLPATGCIWVRDAVRNLSRAAADTELGNELGFRPYWRDRTDPGAGLYYNRLNIADLVSIHLFDAAGAPAWGLGVYGLDPENSGMGHLLVGSNPDAAGRLSLEFGDEPFVADDHLENNGVPGQWIRVSTVVLRSLPSVTPAEYAWWENVDFVRSELLEPMQWVQVPSPLSSSPAFARTAVLGIGFGVGDVQDARREAERIESFFTKYDAAPLVAPDFHYVPAFFSWTDELYNAPPTPAFSNLMGRVRRFAPPVRARTHVLTYLATAFYISSQPEPPHPLADARAWNDQYQPYSVFGTNWRVDPSHPAFVAAFDQAVRTLIAEGVEGAYFDNLFGEGIRNYRQHHGADPSNHLDQIALVDRARSVLGWDAIFVGEQSRLGNRYAAGAFVPCGLRAIPGGAAIPFVDALIHDRRLTVGAGDLLEQWFAHVKFGIRGLANPGRRDVQNIVHDYVFGFVKGQLVLDGRTEYEVDPGGVLPTVPIQIFEADPALHPSWADPAEVLGFEVLNDVADRVYPRMMWWRSETPALQHGRMLRPPYPQARVGGVPVDAWFLLEKDYFFKVPGFSAPPGSTSVYETERFPVSFWALPEDPDQLTLFMGNPTYEPVLLSFDFSTADYPAEMGPDGWDLVIDPDPEDGPDVAPLLVDGDPRHFVFTVRVRPLSFARVRLLRH
jgi:hypothetical protein